MALALVAVAVGVVVVGKPVSAAPPPPPTPTGSVPGAYTAVGPARLFDTRSGLDVPKAVLGANAQVAVAVLGHAGIPASNVSAVALTVTAVGPTTAGGVTAWADGEAKPSTSNLSFPKSVNTANLVLARVGADGKIRLSNNSTGTVNLVGDVAGYYVGGASAAPGTTVATTPARVLDTRFGVGAPRAITAGGTVTVPVSGHAGVPSSGASAVVLTITAVGPTKGGTVTVWKAGITRPSTTNLSLTAGRTIANLVVVPLGTGGAITVWNNTAAALQVIGDVSGYVRSSTAVDGGTMTNNTPARSLDTRTTLGGHLGALAAGGTLALAAGRAGVPTTNVTAVAMTVTVPSAASTGGITAWADGYPRPGTSSMSFVAHQSTSALVFAPVGPDGKVLLYNSSGAAVQLVVDVVGYYRADKLPIVASTSRYVRNLSGASSDSTTMHDEGCADAQGNTPGNQHLVLLDIGAQNLSGTTWRVVLSATSIVLTDAQLVSALNGYIDGYATCRTGTDPVTIAIGTNNDGADGARAAAAGTEWADGVVDAVAAHAAGTAGTAGILIAGANDIEWGFTGTEAEAEAWTRAYLAATSAPYVFAGSADGCPTTTSDAICPTDPAHPTIQWSQANYYNLAHGISPSRILALPQIYYAANAAQWKFISLTGASGADRIDFVGSLSENAACQAPGSGCDMSGLLTPAASWSALRNALSSSAAINLQRLPVATDLRTDTAPGAPASADRVTTAGIS